ncbi:vWA domain-containing protein [Streptomyces sp. AA1529]|uniref:vWA domain-containing protein n=1 Tax=Streptomyces sp. AA1529 TaxID=1203257 RepID=UPI003D705BB4
MSTPGFGPAESYDERQPVVLLLDTSASMARPAESPRIDELNAALVRLFDGVRVKLRLRARVELCLITFDSRVRVLDPARGDLVPVGEAPADRLFVPVDELSPPHLEASGLTRLTEAVETALVLAGDRYRTLQEQRVQVRRPFLWVLTDGAPSDAHGRRADPATVAATAQKVRGGQEQGECVLLAVGVRGADLELLRELAPNGALRLEGLDLEQILEAMFRSSDVIGACAAVDDIHEQVSAEMKRQERMRLLEEKHL